MPLKLPRLCRLEAGEWGRRRLLLVGDGIAYARVGHLPDRSCDKADLSGADPVAHFLFGAEDADTIDLVGGAGRHQPDALALVEPAVEDTHQHDHAEVGVVPAVDEEGLERSVRLAL